MAHTKTQQIKRREKRAEQRAERCAEEGCKNPHAPNRKLCYKHKAQKYRQINPIQAAYYDLRTNAKRRKKVFTITFEYFKELCLASGYHINKGKEADSLSIDRIEDHLGYEPGNIRVITISENSRKNYLAQLIKKQKENPVEGDIVIGNPEECGF